MCQRQTLASSFAAVQWAGAQEFASNCGDLQLSNSCMCSSCHLGIRNLAVERLGRSGWLAGQCYFVQYSHKLLWEIRSMAGCPFSPQNAEAEKVAAQCHCLQCSDECLCKGFLVKHLGAEITMYGWSCWVESNVEEVGLLLHGAFPLWWCVSICFEVKNGNIHFGCWELSKMKLYKRQLWRTTHPSASWLHSVTAAYSWGHCRCGIRGTLDSRSQKHHSCCLKSFEVHALKGANGNSHCFGWQNLVKVLTSLHSILC